MHWMGLIFAVGAVVAIIAFVKMHRRNAEIVRELEEEEAIRSELGYTQLDDFEASVDSEAWRGDQHPEEDDQ